MYRLCLVTGITFGFALVGYLAKKENLPNKNLNILLFILTILFGICSKVAGVLLFGGSFSSLFKQNGETSIFGPLFCLMIFIFIAQRGFLRSYFKDTATLISIITIYFLILQTFGKLGCHFAGCCYGIPTKSSIIGVVPTIHSKYYQTGLRLFPVQFLEFLILLILLIFMLLIFKNKTKRYIIPNIYFHFYFILRFILEFLRADYSPVVSNLKMGQIFSVILLVISFFLYLISKKLT